MVLRRAVQHHGAAAVAHRSAGLLAPGTRGQPPEWGKVAGTMSHSRAPRRVMRCQATCMGAGLAAGFNCGCGGPPGTGRPFAGSVLANPAPSMTENDARAVLLMRSCERAALLGADDAAWAGREARRQLGEAAPATVWLGQRARLALGRLAERQPRLRRQLLAAQSGLGMAPVVALLALAVGYGLLGDGLGSGRRINLLALPLLGLLVWNLAVYGLLAVRVLRPRRQAGLATPGESALLVPAMAQLQALARAWGARLLHGPRAAPTAAHRALAGFATDWLALGRPLLAWRSAALLHAGAALLAVGAVLALYARGLVFDYRAGWDSTFLQPQHVHALLVWLLGPASVLADLPLPDTQALARLRLTGGGGEGAAPWIHRWALTLLLVVVLPRLALAGQAAWQARRLAARLPMPDDPAVLRLLQVEMAAADAPPRAVAVLPYSYRLDAARQAAVPTALLAWLGHGLRCDVQPTLHQGAELNLAPWLPAALARLPAPTSDGHMPAPMLVLVFALTATPERETHGRLVQAVAQALQDHPAPRPQLRVAVDESGYRLRLAGVDAAQRLAQRRAAWESLLMGLGVVPGFIDLTAPAAAGARPPGAAPPARPGQVGAAVPIPLRPVPPPGGRPG